MSENGQSRDSGFVDSLLSTWRKDALVLSGHFAKLWAAKFMDGLRARGKDFGEEYGEGAECVYVSSGISAMQAEMLKAEKSVERSCKVRSAVAAEMLKVARELLS